MKKMYFASLVTLFTVNAFAENTDIYLCHCALSGYEMAPHAKSKEDPTKEFTFYAAAGTDVHAVCRAAYPHEERPANWTDVISANLGLGKPVEPGTKFYSTAYAVCAAVQK